MDERRGVSMVGTLLAVVNVVVEIISNLVVETSASEPADYHMT